MKTIIRYLRMAKKYYGSIALAALGLIGAALLSLATPEVVRRLIAVLQSGQADVGILVWLSAVLLGSYLLKAFCRWLSMWQAHVAAWNFVGDQILACYDKLQSLSLKFYSDKQTGELQSTMVNDTRQLELLIAHAIPDLISNLLIAVLVAVMLFTINPRLAALTMIPVPLIILIGTRFSTKVAPMFRTNQRVLAELNGTLQDNLQGIREIQAFDKEEHEHQRIRNFCSYYSMVNIRANFANALFQPSIEFATSIGTIIVLGFGGLLALRGKMSVSDIVGFFMYLSLFYTPLAALARLSEDIQQAVASGERALDLLDTQSDITDPPAPEHISKPVGNIAFDHVSFSYNPTAVVLRDVTFEAPHGRMTAIVGATGVGKTTAVSLIERFYEPTAGKITLDGVSIDKLKLSELRGSISMVLQDVFLFNGSVADNIAYGCDKATREQVINAAKIACADDFIRALPDGYDTAVGERGMKLSGGQKQRLAIARAVLRNTPVIVLDEATSAVDTETEARIQEAIENLSRSGVERTLIVIAHRLSTVRRADNIIVLQDGGIAEEGTHEQLIRCGGIYSKLCSIQQNTITADN